MMPRQTDYAKLTEMDKVAYNRRLYAKSPRERLRRINYSRARRGAPALASLADAALRIPLGVS